MKSLFIFIIILFLFIPTVAADLGCEVKTRLSEVIIKVNPETIDMPEGIYTAPLKDIRFSSEDMDDLNKKYNLISIEKIFVAPPVGEEAEEDESGIRNTYLY